jgi:hypothetical protein
LAGGIVEAGGAGVRNIRVNSPGDCRDTSSSSGACASGDEGTELMSGRVGRSAWPGFGSGTFQRPAWVNFSRSWESECSSSGFISEP